ncbi:MAG: methyltransferase domain-containing protein, partial [Chloroflexi bacterium]|nr:methyltransferase domain-containing protein [Chloroflexota bacterium]
MTNLWRRRPDLGPAGRRVAAVLVRAYFDVSYGLLGSEAGRQLLRHAAAGGEPVHGYFTIDDRDQLVAVLDPQPGDRLLDLGSGPGGVALEIHRRTGAEIMGIDLAPRAVAAANQRAEGAGGSGAVTFTVGSLSRPPHVGARAAYAIDSLMFVPELTGA